MLGTADSSASPMSRRITLQVIALVDLYVWWVGLSGFIFNFRKLENWTVNVQTTPSVTLEGTVRGRTAKRALGLLEMHEAVTTATKNNCTYYTYSQNENDNTYYT